jgi:hypothetical protein
MTPSMTATISVAPRRRPLPVFPVREVRNEQRINIIPAKSAATKKFSKISIERGRFAPSLCGASIGATAGARLIAAHCCYAATGRMAADLITGRLSSLRQKLANEQNSCCNIGHNRIQAVRLCVSRPGN